MSKKLVEKSYRMVKNYKNGAVCRSKNKRVTAFYNTEKERVNIGFQAILSEEHLSFAGNFIRGNYKNTVFGLSLESAISLHHALTKSLERAMEIENEKNYKNG